MGVQRNTRPPIERIVRIFDLLRQGGVVTRRKLAATLDVNIRTVQRDLDFLRERLGGGVEFDARAGTYRLVGSADVFQVLPVNDGELLALLVARKAIEQHKGTPYEVALASAFEKLLRPLRDQGWTVRLDDLISFQNTGVVPAEVEVFHGLSHALLNQREIAFRYLKPQDAAPSERVIQPLHLACRDDSWYVVGYDLERRAMRTFAVSRMDGVRVLERRFTRPKGFSAAKYFDTAFGVFVGDGAAEVRLRFSSVAAPYVRERFWHASQVLKEADAGGVELSLHVADSVELERWVCSWQGEVEVLAPAALRARVLACARRLAERNA